jgi:hypothetical protein
VRSIAAATSVSKQLRPHLQLVGRNAVKLKPIKVTLCGDILNVGNKGSFFDCIHNMDLATLAVARKGWEVELRHVVADASGHGQSPIAEGPLERAARCSARLV